MNVPYCVSCKTQFIHTITQSLRYILFAQRKASSGLVISFQAPGKERLHHKLWLHITHASLVLSGPIFGIEKRQMLKGLCCQHLQEVGLLEDASCAGYFQGWTLCALKNSTRN